MGILPLQFADGASVSSLGLTGEETFDIAGLEALAAGEVPKEITVRAGHVEFAARVRIDTPMEAEYFRHGGILPYVLRRLAG
jgi:aconitate hydratase